MSFRLFKIASNITWPACHLHGCDPAESDGVY
jgi:hypothetical protein